MLASLRVPGSSVRRPVVAIRHPVERSSRAAEGDPSARALDAQLLHPVFAIVTPTIPGPSADARGVMSEAGHAENHTQANVQVPNDYLLRSHVACFVAWRAEIELTTRVS